MSSGPLPASSSPAPARVILVLKIRRDRICCLCCLPLLVVVYDCCMHAQVADAVREQEQGKAMVYALRKVRHLSAASSVWPSALFCLCRDPSCYTHVIT
jgi:hypothetical protein